MRQSDSRTTRKHPRLVRWLWVIVAVTSVLSLLYGIQYYLGGPLRLAVVSEIYGIDLSPNERYLAGGDGSGTVHIWRVPLKVRARVDKTFDVSEQDPWSRRMLSELAEPVLGVRFTPDGETLIAVSSGGTVRTWLVEDERTTDAFDLNVGPLVDVHLSESGRILATIGEDGLVRVWDLERRVQIQSFEPSEGSRQAVVLNMSGTLVAAGSGQDIEVWDVGTGEEVRVLQAYCDTGKIDVDSIGTTQGIDRFCKTDKADIALATREITERELAYCRRIQREPIQFQVGMDALVPVVSRENDFLQDVTMEELALIFSTARRWSDVHEDWPDETIQRYVPVADHENYEFFVQQVFGGEDSALRRASNTEFAAYDADLIQGVLDDPHAITFLAYASYVQNDSVLRYATVEGVAPTTESVRNGEYPLSRPLYLYSTAGIMAGAGEKPQVAAFIDVYLSSVDEETARAGVFPAPDSALGAARQAWQEAMAGLGQPDIRGDIAIAGSPTMATLTARVVGHFRQAALPTKEACLEAGEEWLGHDDVITALAFSPDDTLLVSGSADTTIKAWVLDSGEVDWGSAGHWAAVTTLVFREDGSSVLSGGGDNWIRNLNVPGGKSSATYEGHLSAVTSVAYGPQEEDSSDEIIFTAARDGTLRAWGTANQYVVHLEWSRPGLQPIWGRTLAVWMLASGVLGIVSLYGLWRSQVWSHLLLLAVFIIGPVVVLGLPLLEMVELSWFLYLVLGLAVVWVGRKVRDYVGSWWVLCVVVALAIVLAGPYLSWRAAPRTTGMTLELTWPLMVLAVWYVLLLLVAVQRAVSERYEAPGSAALADMLMISRRTVRIRTGIYVLAVWVGLLVLVFSVLRQFNLDIAFMGSFLEFITLGSGITFYVSAASILLAVILALLGALGRLSSNPIANGVSGFYISLIRGTPLLVQIYIWYLGLPRLDIVLPATIAGVLALGVNYGAYMTEIFRAGIQAVSLGQREAAQALGMSSAQTFRRIILPQAFRIVIPPIGNEFIAMMKDSSLVSIMAVHELTWRAKKIGNQYFRNMETFIIAAAFYWILTVLFQLVQGRLEEYLARSERR